mmetsp:Transcript_7446/g.22292  ORF Transcript_7446/g.22292 Transcript_7446/m.22292 type:complete len:258 (-) Transcript_7446:262-1035(-)
MSWARQAGHDVFVLYYCYSLISQALTYLLLLLFTASSLGSISPFLCSLLNAEAATMGVLLSVLMLPSISSVVATFFVSGWNLFLPSLGGRTLARSSASSRFRSTRSARSLSSLLIAFSVFLMGTNRWLGISWGFLKRCSSAVRFVSDGTAAVEVLFACSISSRWASSATISATTSWCASYCGLYEQPAGSTTVESLTLSAFWRFSLFFETETAGATLPPPSLPLLPQRSYNGASTSCLCLFSLELSALSKAFWFGLA